MDPLIDRREYAGLANCTYLNQASLGLIPRVSLEASVRFLTDIAQHGNLRLSDQAEAEILDALRAAAAGLLGAPVASIADLSVGHERGQVGGERSVAVAGPLKGSRVAARPVGVRFPAGDTAIVVSEDGIVFPGQDAVASERLVRATWVLVRRDGG